MTSDTNKLNKKKPASKTIDDLLRGSTDEKEKARLKTLCGSLALNDPLSDEDLKKIAAAGTRASFSVDGLWYGTEMDENVSGGSGDDTIHAGGGNDQVFGNSGNDVVDGGSGDDYLRGKAGDDTVLGGSGDDIVIGGSGNDVVDGGTGHDFLIMEGGNDTIIGGQGDDTFIFRGRSEGDYVINDYTPDEDNITLWMEDGMEEYTITYDGEGNSLISWGKVTITVMGQEITDDDIHAPSDLNDTTNSSDFFMDGKAWTGEKVDGLDGNDTMWGAGGDDTFSGGEGDDRLHGGAGNDILDGNAGDDFIRGGSGDDTLTGGEGADTFSFDSDDGNDIITDFTVGEDRIMLDGVVPGSWSISYDPETETSIITHGDATITVEGAEVTAADLEIGYTATEGPDVFDLGYFTGDGSTITGFDPSQDRITVSGDYNISYDPETGNTTISHQNGTLTVKGVEVSTEVIDQSVTGSAGVDFIATNDGNDTANGAGGDDYIFGAGGNDILSGGKGNDHVIGGEGNDVIYGGFGQDGDDALSGGTGADTFVLGSNHGNDTITDFNPDEDALNLLGADSSDDFQVEIVNGNTVITFGSSTITLTGVELSAEDIMDSMKGLDTDDTLAGTSGDNTLEGGAGNDFLGGAGGDDVLKGGSGNDVVLGGAGEDSMSGGSGNDTLNGGAGDDRIYGGLTGDDQMTGGLGADTFVFNAGGGHDTITDFDPSQDSLDLLGVDSMDNISVEIVDGNTVITFGATTITLTGVEMTQEQVWECVVT